MKQDELYEFYDKTTVNKQIDKIAVNLLLEFFGVDIENQIIDIQKHPILSNYFSIEKEEYLLTKKAFILYVLWLSPDIIPENNRDNFLLYQEYLIDYLYDDSINREQIVKKSIMLKNQIGKIERELELDERVVQINLLKQQLKQADLGVKQLNNRLVSNIQTTLDI